MNNDELKKKIVDIVNEWHWFQKRDANGNTIWQANDTEKLADALIAAGIGDVKEAEHRAEIAERAFKELCIDKIFGQDDEHSIKWLLDFYKARAEKELAEEKKDE